MENQQSHTTRAEQDPAQPLRCGLQPGRAMDLAQGSAALLRDAAASGLVGSKQVGRSDRIRPRRLSRWCRQRETRAFQFAVLRCDGQLACDRPGANRVVPGFPLADSRSRGQISWFSWCSDYPAPSGFIEPLLTCSSFLPHNPANLNLAEFCDPSIDAQVQSAEASHASTPGTGNGIWAPIDRELTNQATWLPAHFKPTRTARADRSRRDPGAARRAPRPVLRRWL